MHIALWSPAWPLEKFQNGIVTFVHWMKREFESQGQRVSVFTGELDPSSAPEPRVYHVRRTRWSRAVRRISRGARSNEPDVFEFAAAIAAEMRRVHRRDPIDIVEMEESFGWFADVGRLTSLPLVVKLHGPAFLSLVEDELHTAFAREKIDREGRALHLATAIASPSASTLAQTIERYGLTPRERRLIVNPLTMDGDTPVWDPQKCERNTILFVGRFDLRKGADIVLKAFLSMLQLRRNLKLIFVGPDRGLSLPDGNRIHFAAYCNALFPNEFRDRVEFRGPMGNREIAKLRAQAMVTVVASRWENAGYTLLEAMFQGCPIVSTDAGGCPESVIDGVTGRLAKSEDPRDFAVQLCAMLDDPLGAQVMGQAARRKVMEQHTAAAVAAASIEMYQSVISSHGS
jgi:glycosyltransferase involved in cell wall biosynthesis